MQLENSVMVTIAGYEFDLKDTINIILAFVERVLKAYIPGFGEEAE